MTLQLGRRAIRVPLALRGAAVTGVLGAVDKAADRVSNQPTGLGSGVLWRIIAARTLSWPMRSIRSRRLARPEAARVCCRYGAGRGYADGLIMEVQTGSADGSDRRRPADSTAEVAAAKSPPRTTVKSSRSDSPPSSAARCSRTVPRMAGGIATVRTPAADFGGVTMRWPVSSFTCWRRTETTLARVGHQ